MVRPAALLVLLALAGCDRARYHEPISMAPHGAAVRANMAAMIINPTAPLDDPGPADTARALLALERYRADEAERPRDVGTAPAAGVTAE